MSATERSLIDPSEADIAGAEQDQQDVLARKKPGLRQHIGGGWKQRLLFAFGGGSTLLAVACGSGASSSETADRIPAAVATTAPEPTPSPRPTATAIREPSPTPESTATAVPAATPTSEATPGPQKSPTKEVEPQDECSFMGIKCSKADLLKKNIDGIDYYYVGLNFPEGTEIPFPIDGQLSFIELSPDAPFRGGSVTITNTDRSLRLPVFSFYGSLEKTTTPLGVNLPKDTPAVKTSKEEGRKNYGYDVVFLASRQNPVTKKPESLLDVYKAAIPNLSDKSIEVKSQGSTAYYAGDVFLSPSS